MFYVTAIVGDDDNMQVRIIATVIVVVVMFLVIIIIVAVLFFRRYVNHNPIAYILYISAIDTILILIIFN